MPLQTFDALKLIKPRNSGLQDIMSQELDNAFKRQRNIQEPERFETEQALHGAQTQEHLRKAKFGNLQGSAAKLLSLRSLEEELGADDPTVKAAKEDYDLEVESQKLTNARNRVLNDTAYQRMSTGDAKQLFEQREIENGYAPGTMYSDRPVRLSPEEQEKLQAQYEARNSMKQADSATRQKKLAADTADITFKEIDVNALTKFSGISGAIEKKIKQGQSLTGQESKDYDAYQENLVKAEILADQLRTYFGTSVSPSNLKRIEKLTNPGDWKTSPQTAKKNFLSLKDLFEKESAVYRNAANPGRKSESASSRESNNSQMVTIRNRLTGETKQVSKEEADAMVGR